MALLYTLVKAHKEKSYGPFEKICTTHKEHLIIYAINGLHTIIHPNISNSYLSLSSMYNTFYYIKPIKLILFAYLLI